MQIVVQTLFCSNFFLETKFSIQLSLRRFLFELNGTSISREILSKLCASHHASTHNSEKSCFRLRLNGMCRCNFSSLWSAGETMKFLSYTYQKKFSLKSTQPV